MKTLPFFILLLLILSFTNFAQKAFPDAEGFGSETRAAYGITITPKILVVNSYSDTESGNLTTGKGTLRWCLTRNFPRIVLFSVGGTFTLYSPIHIKNPYISIYGQSAPNGVLIIGNAIGINTHDVLIQHIALRPGNELDPQTDGLAIMNSSRNVIIDHCSIEWAVDELAETWSNNHHISKVTFSNCIMAECLDSSTHSEGPHSKGLMIGTIADSISIIKNFIAHNRDRSPLIQGGTSTEVINNLIYNSSPGIMYNDYSSLPIISSAINNQVFKGANFTKRHTVRIYGISPRSKIFLSGNSDGTDAWDYVRDDNNFESSVRSETPPLLSNVTILKREEVVNYVLSNVGSRYWSRDAVDTRVLNSFINKTGKVINCVEGCVRSAGGWHLYLNSKHTLDIPANPHNDDNKNGYTNLEEWVFHSQSPKMKRQ
jgi:pectate lyase